jgi:hypothetical protein
MIFEPLRFQLPHIIFWFEAIGSMSLVLLRGLDHAPSITIHQEKKERRQRTFQNATIGMKKLGV